MGTALFLVARNCLNFSNTDKCPFPQQGHVILLLERFSADVLANRIGPGSLIKSNTHVVHGKKEEKPPKHS